VPVFALAVLGIFLYVGAEVCMSTFLIPSLEAFGFSDKAAAWAGPVAFLGSITFGRIVGGSVRVSPRAFFRLSTLLGLAGLGLMMTCRKELALAGVVCGGLGCANVWPMLFSITVEEKPECANELSGLMCMAISGGALVPLVMSSVIKHGLKEVGKIWVMTDATWVVLAFLVPGACFAYLFLLSLKGGRKPAPAPAKA
jgi:MFS transporter, FHS family, L-fucose permease